MSSASHAAALAAFKGIQKDGTNSYNNKKPFQIPQIKTSGSPTTENPPNIAKPKHKRNLSSHSLPRIQTKPASPSVTGRQINSIYDVKDLKLSPQTPGSITTSPMETESVRSGTDYFTLSPNSIYKSPASMKKSGSNHSNLNINHARTQETLNNLKSSLQSKINGKDPSLKRKSHDTAPHDMLNKMKQSIADKSISSNIAESTTRNSERINEIRDSIDSKRITTHVGNSFSLELDDGYQTDGNNHSTNSSYDNFPYIKPGNKSYGSFGSSLSIEETPNDILKPSIITTDVDGEELLQPVAPIRSGGSSPISPIAIPPSSSANARGTALGSNESVNYSKYNKLQQSFDSNKTASDESSKIKLKRKPPPNIEGSDLSNTYSRSSFDYYTSETDEDLDTKHTDSDVRDSDVRDMDPRVNEKDLRLPQYPDINNKKPKESKHHIFKKKYRSRGLDHIDLSNLEPFADPTTSSAPTTPLVTHQNQPVQLKTTMRKTKHSKKSFNEEKPWKNHTDLIYITEQERKRYEGVWVSNKGSYINRIVTKLRGVRYDEEIPRGEAKEMEMDPSIRAAKLSSSQHDTVDNFESFHGLDFIEPQDLICASVVKRIWSRSRLPNETLQQIWELVDQRKDGTLNKPEFLVGMWVVDQCLYGRKLPKKIEDETWASLESIGLNVVIKKRGKR